MSFREWSQTRGVEMWADFDPDNTGGPFWTHRRRDVCNCITHPKGYAPTRVLVFLDPKRLAKGDDNPIPGPAT